MEPAVTNARKRILLPRPGRPWHRLRALLRAAQGGNHAAMERLLMKAQEIAYRFSLLVCGHADDADDAMQRPC